MIVTSLYQNNKVLLFIHFILLNSYAMENNKLFWAHRRGCCTFRYRETQPDSNIKRASSSGSQLLRSPQLASTKGMD